MSRRARSGSTVAAASVPATVTLWGSRAEMIRPAQVVCRLHLYLLSLVSICARPAFHSMVGVGQVAAGLQDSVMSQVRSYVSF